MAQQIQIVPSFSFPYVETVINDYTTVTDDSSSSIVDTAVTQAYAVVSSKGIDNKWIRKTSRTSAIKSFGDSNFKKYGQPLMQALHVLEQNNSAVWFMRVMPENAAYANSIVSVFYKADTAEDVPNASDRKFRIKLTSKSLKDMFSTDDLEKAITQEEFKEKDSEGYSQAQLLTVRYTGRGTCGNFYSMRMSQAYSYEKEYGIKMYNFEVLTSESGIEKDANYVGTLISSAKYGSESTTLIDDVLDDAELGVPPIDVRCNEESMDLLYNTYVQFLKTWNADLISEYESKLDEYQIPEDMLNGTISVSDEYKDKYIEIRNIASMIDASSDDNIPDIDEFDILFGLQVASTTDTLPGILYPEKLTDEVDTTAEDYDEKMYTTTENLVDFSSIKGLILSNGDDGYFNEPRTVVDSTTGQKVKWTYEQEVIDAMIKAYDGTHDKRILSPRRINVSAFFDANYPYEVKNAIVDIASGRNDCRVYLDTGIINNLSLAQISTLISEYNVFNSHMVSTDIHNYDVKEYSTNKKCTVTISYFLANQYVYHITENGMHIPFVKEDCQLSGHARDSIRPIIEEYDLNTKELLYNNRLNYFECYSENVFRRAVQNTTQKTETDLLEESNSTILYTLKRNIEKDIQGQIYNFADETVRRDFVEVETAAYSSWVGEIIESLEISFQTSEYEFNRSILHLYVAIVFRGLTKKCIVEIDINKRTYQSSTSEEDEE